MKLAELIQQKTFASPQQEAMLSIIVTGSWLLHEMGVTMGEHSITPAQYNVLRILRGSDPNRLTCSDIGARLLDRTPDVTRLLNRLEKAQYIVRERAKHDRRVVEVGITEKGKTLLETMHDDVETMQTRLMEHLSAAEASQMVSLLERVRHAQHQGVSGDGAMAEPA